MSVASKNLFDLLGNDEDDSDSPKAPVKTVDKTSTHTTKRNADGQAPNQKPGGTTGSRRGGFAGSDGAFRDRNIGSDRNRGKPADDSGRADAPRGGRGARTRGGPGARHPRNHDDRHTKGGPGGGSDKQADRAWGAETGAAEMKDEEAGEQIAQTERKEIDGEAAAPTEAEPEEPEEKHISYDDYLAQQAEKKLALAAEGIKVRKPNEGSKTDKKWAGAKQLEKDEDEDYFAGTGGKAKRERERKTKQLVEIDNRYVEPERSARGGPGGGGRGGGRGGDRGDRPHRGGERGGRGGPRGDRGGARGDFRGGRGDRGGARGDFRGGRGGGGRGAENKALNPNDQSAFPSLGS